MGRSQRTKGHAFERKVAQDLRAIFPNAKRHLEYQSSEALEGVDIEGTGDFKVQCKAMKRMPNIPEAMKNIVCKDDDIPVVISKIDRKGSYATFKYEDALLLINAYTKHI